MVFGFNNSDYCLIEQFYDRIFVPGHIMPCGAHRHVGFEIMYFVQGKASVEVYDDPKDEPVEIYKMYPGDFIFLDSSHYHHLKVSQTGANIINFEVSPHKKEIYAGQRTFGSMIGRSALLGEFFSSKTDPVFRLFDNGDVLSEMSLIIKKCLDESYDNAALYNLLSVLLSDVAVLYMKNKKAYSGYAYVKNAVKEIDNACGNITQDELTKEVGVSARYLSKLFKTCFDKSVTEYVREYKINRACNRFRLFQNVKISDVAQELGLYKPFAV